MILRNRKKSGLVQAARYSLSARNRFGTIVERRGAIWCMTCVRGICALAGRGLIILEPRLAPPCR